MASRPRLPDDFELPDAVNGWQYDPESGKNAHAWYSTAGTEAVGVFSSFGRAYAKVSDERVNGFERGVTFAETELSDDDLHTERERQAVAGVVDDAVAWMQAHTPDEWSHPDVNEAVFDPPAGYVLERYFLEARDTTVYYRREGAESETNLNPGDPPEEVSPDTYQYLVVHIWNGSGNATVSLAPWTRAHDHEMVEVVETPEECGLDVALAMARTYVREHVSDVDSDGDAVASGQTDLQQFAQEIP